MHPLIEKRYAEMDMTVALTGALPAIVIISAALIVRVSGVLLRLYRRSMLHANTPMGQINDISRQRYNTRMGALWV